MDAMHKDKSLDALLDKTLAALGDVEPREGLEYRILTSLRAEDRRLGSLRSSYLVLGSAVAVMVLAGTVWMVVPRISPVNRGTTARVSPEGGVTKPQSEEAQRMNPVRIAGRSRYAHSTAGGTALPKQREFPSPRPLSVQEKLLLAYISAAPDSEVRAAAAKRASNASDLQIGELKIAPLSLDEYTNETSTNK